MVAGVMGVFRDLADEKFGRLSVAGPAGKNRSGNYLWVVKCECGKEKTVPSDHLTRKVQPVVSCGCFRNDQVRAALSQRPDEVAFRLLIGTYRKRARAKGFLFLLSEDDFRKITSSDCAYCGAEPSLVIENKPKTGRYTYNTVDRKDPARGYVGENCAPCCKTCNYMKWTMGADEFVARAKRIAARSHQ